MQKNLKQLLEIKNATSEALDLYFYGEIISDRDLKYSDAEKSPSEITDFLKEANGRALNIYINSPGGNVFDGMAIYSMIKRYNGKTTAYIDGVAASIASVIAFSCQKVVMPKNSFLMIHKPMSMVFGNADDFIETAIVLNRIEQGILDTYAEHLKDGVNIETVKNYMQGEGKWFTATEASEIFNIELAEENKIAADITGLTDVPDNIKNAVKKIRGDTNEQTNKLLQAKLRLISYKNIER